MFISEMFGDASFGLASFTMPTYSIFVFKFGETALQILTETGRIGLRLSYNINLQNLYIERAFMTKTGNSILM